MTPHSPLVSVVVACFNDGETLLEAVQSAEDWPGGGQEVIVVDDGSTDSVTLRLLNEVSQRGHAVVRRTNGGPAAARNTGIRQARGRYILPLDADNRLRRAYFVQGSRILEAESDVDVVYGDPQDFGLRQGRRRIPNFDLVRMAQNNYIDTCAMYRRSLWERLGGYDEDPALRGVEDWDFWMRAGLARAGFRHLDEVLYDYRVRPGSLTERMQNAAVQAGVKSYWQTKPIQSYLGDYINAANSWKPVVDDLRRRPVRGLLKVLGVAFLPKPYALWWRYRHGTSRENEAI